MRALKGWGFIDTTEPNISHKFCNHLKNINKSIGIVTQNVDSLHMKSGTSKTDLLELHGTLREVKCLNCGHTYDRNDVQNKFMKINSHFFEN